MMSWETFDSVTSVMIGAIPRCGFEIFIFIPAMSENGLSSNVVTKTVIVFDPIPTGVIVTSNFACSEKNIDEKP